MPKSFYTQGENDSQVLKQVSENNLIIYDKLSDIKADIDNLEEGQIVATVEDEYSSGGGGGEGIAFAGTRAELEEALKIEEGQEGYIPENALVLIVDESEELSD